MSPMVVGVTVVLTVIPTTLSSSARLHYSSADNSIPNHEVYWSPRTGDNFISSLHHSPAFSYWRCIYRGKMDISKCKYSQVCDGIIRKERIEKRGLVRCKLPIKGPLTVEKTSPNKTESPIIEQPKYPQKSQQ